tara:strand:+ start:610 stop:1893 length:1284 start_codon:yes stop_codon:yes gene_type:complete
MENTLDAALPIVEIKTPVVAELQVIIDADEGMRIALLASLNVACIKANNTLDKDLYKAMNKELNGNAWPDTIEKYFNYLEQYVKMVPNESLSAEYPEAWKSSNTQNGYNQKVYDFLCQFYWLIDQKVPDTELSMQSFEKFANWLVKFAQAWGSFLGTTASLTPESLKSFKDNPMYNFKLYADNESSWTTFNEFFYREFNGAAAGTKKSPLRPITDPTNNNTIVAPADCTYKENYPIDANGNVIDNEGAKTSVSLKNTHSIGNVKELLDGSDYAEAFNGGTFVHYFLGPFDYHRFHTPVSGKILEIKKILGKVFLNVDLIDGQWDAPDGAGEGYEFSQARGLVIMDTVELGKVAILPIGMCQVSGVLMNTDLKDKDVVKGQEFGKFQFGGSDIIMVFEKKPADLYMYKNDPGHNPIHFQYGQTAVLAI